MLLSDSEVRVEPVRALMTDAAADILAFAIDAFAEGPVALATLVEIRGGAARAIGSHVAIAADGRYCGYVSGGCVEAAVAAEALEAMGEGCDRSVRFGSGSPFFDIALPCGGGITVSIHLLRDVNPLSQVLKRLALRQSAALLYSPQSQAVALIEAIRAGWSQEGFTSVYTPQTRLIISGRSIEAEAIRSLSKSTRVEVASLDDTRTVDDMTNLIDPFSAVALLHHDLDAESALLSVALQSPAFYIGALGSTRTHRKRCERLKASGFGDKELARIKAPIGMFGPTKDSTSLALSVLADVAAARLAMFS